MKIGFSIIIFFFIGLSISFVYAIDNGSGFDINNDIINKEMNIQCGKIKGEYGCIWNRLRNESIFQSLSNNGNYSIAYSLFDSTNIKHRNELWISSNKEDIYVIKSEFKNFGVNDGKIDNITFCIFGNGQKCSKPILFEISDVDVGKEIILRKQNFIEVSLKQLEGLTDIDKIWRIKDDFSRYDKELKKIIFEFEKWYPDEIKAFKPKYELLTKKLDLKNKLYSIQRNMNVINPDFDTGSILKVLEELSKSQMSGETLLDSADIYTIDEIKKDLSKKQNKSINTGNVQNINVITGNRNTVNEIKVTNNNNKSLSNKPDVGKDIIIDKTKSIEKDIKQLEGESNFKTIKNSYNNLLNNEKENQKLIIDFKKNYPDEIQKFEYSYNKYKKIINFKMVLYALKQNIDKDFDVKGIDSEKILNGISNPQISGEVLLDNTDKDTIKELKKIISERQNKVLEKKNQNPTVTGNTKQLKDNNTSENIKPSVNFTGNNINNKDFEKKTETVKINKSDEKLIKKDIIQSGNSGTKVNINQTGDKNLEENDIKFGTGIIQTGNNIQIKNIEKENYTIGKIKVTISKTDEDKWSILIVDGKITKSNKYKYIDKDGLIALNDKDKVIVKVINFDNTEQLILYPKTTKIYKKINWYKMTDGYLIYNYQDNDGKLLTGKIEIYKSLTQSGNTNSKSIDNNSGDIQNNQQKTNLSADIIKEEKYSKMIYLFVIPIIIIVIIIFDIFKNKYFNKKIDLKKEIDKIKNNNIFLSKPIYEVNLFQLYNKILGYGYNLTPSFLTNFIVSIKSRGIVILFGGNGVGKTSFVYNFLKGLYGENFQKYFLKVLIKEDIDNEKKFIGFYDRLNNNYVDTFNLTKFIIQAYNDKNNPYFLLLDEMNLSDIEKFFPYFIESDKIIEEGVSELIKISEITDFESNENKIHKMEMIKGYGFLVENFKGGYSIGYRIPKNLFIIGTINIDSQTQPFTGKVIDRSDIIKMKYMGNIKTDLSLDYLKEIIIDFDDVINLNFNDIDNDFKNFISKLNNIFELSKRTNISIYKYIFFFKKLGKINTSDIINQKVLPKIFGNNNTDKLYELLELCIEYNEKLNLQNSIDEINNILKSNFKNFWKI